MTSVDTEEQGHREVMGEINFPSKVIEWNQASTETYTLHAPGANGAGQTHYLPTSPFSQPFVIAYTDEDQAANAAVATIQHEYRVYWRNIQN